MIFCPYFVELLGNTFSQLAVGMQRPEALSPRHLPSLLESCLKNVVHLRAAVGKMQNLIGSDFRIQIIVFPGGVHAGNNITRARSFVNRLQLIKFTIICNGKT